MQKSHVAATVLATLACRCGGLFKLTAPGSMEEQVATLRALRGQVRRLQRQRAEIHKAAHVVHTPTLMLRLRVVLVFCLCNSMHWTMLWGTWFQRRQRGVYSDSHHPLSGSLVASWVRGLQGHHLVHGAMQAICHPWRVAAAPSWWRHW